MASLVGKSNSLQSKVLIHLRSIFTMAMENGLVAKSPVSSMLKAGGKRTEEKTALTPEESRLLLKRGTDIRARTFLLIALHTGMRRKEIIGLMWEDIDFHNQRRPQNKGRTAGYPHVGRTEMLADRMEKQVQLEARVHHERR